MVKLELEITDKMMEKLQGRADACAVEPADIAKLILANELTKGEKLCWADRLSTIVSHVSEVVIAASKMVAEESEQK